MLLPTTTNTKQLQSWYTKRRGMSNGILRFGIRHLRLFRRRTYSEKLLCAIGAMVVVFLFATVILFSTMEGLPSLPMRDLARIGIPIKDQVSELKQAQIEAKAEQLKKVQIQEDVENTNRRESVRSALKHAWDGYADTCFGKDELNPVTATCKTWMNMGLTLIDSLDTLYLMGFTEEFKRARDWVATSMNTAHGGSVSFFETTIRVLGGLLSAFELSDDAVFLEKAADVGERLSKAFNTPSGLPRSSVNMASGSSSTFGYNHGGTQLAELGTVELEFRYLAEKTGEKKYADMAENVFDKLSEMKLRYKGIFQSHIRVGDEKPREAGGKFTFGAEADSFYEYLVKYWMMTGKTNEKLRTMYLDAIDGMFTHLYRQHDKSGLWFVGELTSGGKFTHKMEHLACFVPGMLVLGVESGMVTDPDLQNKHIDAAAKLTTTCHQMSQNWASGVAPEYIHLRPGQDMGIGADYYILRPEASEAMFYMWRHTHDKKYRDMAWDVFQGIEKHAKQTIGYASLRNIANQRPTADRTGIMQSFLLAETFKYHFLIFSDDDVLPLDKFVFNTEAHPLAVLV
eukprot:125263_1